MPVQALLHPDAHEEGGLGFTDKELLERQRGCAGPALPGFLPRQTAPLSVYCELPGRIIASLNQPMFIFFVCRAVVEVVKNLGSSLLTGNFDLLKMSLPVKL